MLISEIKYLDKGKYSVILDNDEEILLYRSEIKDLGLEEGFALTEELYEHIIVDVLGLRAKKRAMHILEKRDKTEKQLRDKLNENHYPQKSIDIAIDYVKSFKYLDDERYCYNYISYRIEKKSFQKLKAELMTKGISKELIDETYEELYQSSYTENQIRDLLQKKRYNDYSDDKDKRRKIIQSILRKGYTFSQIKAVIDCNDLSQDIEY